MKVSAEAGDSADTGFAMLAKTLQVQREEEVSSVQEELRQNTIRLISSTHTTLVKARFERSLVWLRKKMSCAEAEERTDSVIRLVCGGFCIHRCWWLVSVTLSRNMLMGMDLSYLTRVMYTYT